MILHSISDPSRVRFTGPLTPFAAALTAELAALGYASTSAANLLQLTAHLSRWLQARGRGPADLTGQTIREFLVDRRHDYRNLYSLQALGPTLGYLRRVGPVPTSEATAPVGPVKSWWPGSGTTCFSSARSRSRWLARTCVGCARSWPRSPSPTLN